MPKQNAENQAATMLAGFTGAVLIDGDGKILAASGNGADPRVQVLVTDAEWIAEALEKRVAPILLAEKRMICVLCPLPQGTIVLICDAIPELVLNFFLTVPFAFDIIGHILSDPYEAMTVVDANGKVAFLSPVHEKALGVKDSAALGKNVRDVIPNTRLHHVVKTGIAEVGQIFPMKDGQRVVSRHPIRHDDKVVGAIGRIMFKGPQQLEAMTKRIHALEHEIAVYKQESKDNIGGDQYLNAIIGQSLAIQSVRQQIRKVAALDIPVLIQGESGTGKELVAQALHMLSPRKDARLVTVNAAALPDSLVESELFGYEAGSFTGADRKGRPGKFEQAHKGTIFLDEIGDMALDTQSKLLRVLQDRVVERVGGDKPKSVDFRLCSATNHDLEELVEKGQFRLDLYYRICPVVIALPRLEDRLEDIPLLLSHFVSDVARQYNRPVPDLDLDVASFLMEQKWPGNVRQLRHMVERAFVFADHGKLTQAHFSREPQQAAALPEAAVRQPAGPKTLQESLEGLETQLINDALIRFQGNKKKAAEYLGVSRSFLYKKLGTCGD